ncbi:MAG TPA: NADP-dependent malic enzyme [Saprospiraceae bacterium]|nr:NADP-dependent malic enzyme [Saprospiraceae bacterium]
MSIEENLKKMRKTVLEYHEFPRPGKIEVVPTKPCATQEELSLAYTPGVAIPCLEIEKNPALARKYTAKGNLVAVVTNGTAVLGLGNIGPLAGKPVMEGKGVLFKRFADVDVFDIEVNSNDPDEIIRTVRNIALTFGGINLEDIKAPECFYIEETLKRELDIPVFHDDQHGTAIISGAALINAIELTGKDIGQVKVVIAGAGAAGIACANFYMHLGVKLENILMTDTKGVLWIGRGDETKNTYKQKFFKETDARDLADAMRGADIFSGFSVKDILTSEMVKSMADRPIIFAMANPDPEITYPLARKARPDAIIATGRSDYPNQVNNVLGFPFIFRGALDVEASSINEEMKLAAAMSLAQLAKEDVPDSVKLAYNDMTLAFGPDYIIPKPFDPRVLVSTASAVAEAAMRSGVARRQVNIEEYRESLRVKVDWSRAFMRDIYIVAKKEPRRIVFPEGDDPKIIRAATQIAKEGLAKPILLAEDKDGLLKKFTELRHTPKDIEILEPGKWPYKEEYIRAYYQLRQRKGITKSQAAYDLQNYFYFAAMMVRQGHADSMVAGITVNYPDVLRPALQIIGPKEAGKHVMGMYMLQHEHKTYFYADAAVNINPDADLLTEITMLAIEEMERLGIKPSIAVLSFSNFGSARSPESEKMETVVKRVREVRPDLPVDGPVQPDVALDPEYRAEHFPFARIHAVPNLLIFPNLDAANISLRLVRHMSTAHSIGPIIVGLAKPIQLLPKGTEVENIINMTAIAAVDALHAQNRQTQMFS